MLTSLITRYLGREVAQTFFAVILVVLLIAISNKFVRLVGQAASGLISPEVLLQAILFQIPDLLAFLLPVALFLAILLCYSRMFIDNEILVMFACGLSWQYLMRVALSLGVLIMILVFSITNFLGPYLAQYRERLLRTEGASLLIQTVSPGRFHAFSKEKLVLYVAQLNSDRTELKKVFIAEMPQDSLQDPAQEQRVITAQAGQVVTDQETGLTYFKLFAGRRYEGTPGEKDYSVIAFESYERLLVENAPPTGLYYHRTMPTKMLWQNPSRSNWAELQWRLSLPLSAPLLALLAVPLSRVNPRTGRLLSLFVAILLCILYYNLLTLSKRWVASGVLSPWIGVWWVHLLLLMGSLICFWVISGKMMPVLNRFKKKLNKL